MLTVLALVAALDIADCWVGAGFIRNAVWDALHDRPWTLGAGDVDVLYFDRGRTDVEDEVLLENRLRNADGAIDWSVKNQARMHRRNDDAPYQNTSDAVAHWPETCTAIAARQHHGQVQLLAPHGVEDLLTLVIRPTASGRRKPAEFQARVQHKGWMNRWPKLRQA